MMRILIRRIPTAGKNETANTAYLFDEASSHMIVPNSASLNPSISITIITGATTWVYQG